ncbi:MAG: glycosyltransferase [Desulfobacterales bacterium]|nr:glycosyltransferase [Desulfobacterales bacterium]MCP4162066.1 glycosyltransferase [Deltaproteobacteria bacterium]
MLLLIFTILWFLTLNYFLYTLFKILLFRNVLNPKKQKPVNHFPFVSIIIPARNEEHNIRRCITSLLSQSYPADRYKIIVVNDNSIDATESIIKELASNDNKVHLINKGEPEPEWTGKNSACNEGSKHAGGDYICFIDADTKSETDLIKISVSYAEENKIDMLSVSPFQELGSFTEKCLLPGIFLAIASSMNFKNINNPVKPEAIANGQFILFRKSVYDDIEGHNSVKSIVMEDIALAEVVKHNGYRLFFIFGDDLIRTRMYTKLSEIWEGFSKNIAVIMKTRTFFTTFLSSLKSIFIGLAPLIIPLFLFFNQDSYSLYTLSFFGVGFTSLFILSFFSLRAMGVSPLYMIFFPVGFTFHSIISLSSIFKQKKGRTEWKGRKY